MNRYLKLFLFFAVAAVAIILASPSIQAQIKNIYDSSEENVGGITSLMSAVASDDLNGVKFFSRAGGALVNQKNIGGATALHMACREASFEIIKTLVDSGADVNAVDNEGWTPLMRAALAGKKEAVDLLLIKGAQASALNATGESAIFHAASSDCNECLSLMFEKFNFVTFMETDVLKAQLADTFVVARNRNNQVGQDMIAAYLDRVAQVAPKVEKEKKVSAPFVPVTPTETSLEKGKKFVFKTDGKTGKRGKVVKVEEELPIVPCPTPAEVKGEFTQEELYATKFKFVAGEPGKLRKKGIKKNCIVKNEPSKESAALTKSDEEVKNVELEVVESASVGGVTYKFNRGSESKKIKGKVIEKEPVAVQPVVDEEVKAAEVDVVEKSAPANGVTYKFSRGPEGKKIKRKVIKKKVVEPVSEIKPVATVPTVQPQTSPAPAAPTQPETAPAQTNPIPTPAAEPQTAPTPPVPTTPAK